MKNFSLILILICLVNYNSKAQDKTAFEKGTVVVTAGYGFPDFYRASLRSSYGIYNSNEVSGFGPIIVKGDYGIVKFKWRHTLGAGIILGFSSTKVQYTNYYVGGKGLSSGADSYRTITIGGRGTYHFFTKEKMDCYVSLGAGFNINSARYSIVYPDGGDYLYGGYSKARIQTRSALYGSATIGIRYYFTKNMGVYAEAGWDMSAPIQGGLAIKF
ncbi:MAG: hypothetical protein V4580_19570 [Bacteroidota bacterium]